MPITVVCPGCKAKLNAPDSAAGKRVKCPKPNCGSAITVPAPVADFEVIEEEKVAPKPAPKPKKAVVEVDDEDEDDAPKKPKKKPARAVEDDEDEDERPRKKAKTRAADEDEDEDDEDDRPTKKRKKQKAAGISPAVIAAIAVVGLLVLGGAGYGIYALAFQKKEETAGPNTNPPGQNPQPKTPSLVDGWEEYRSDKDKFKIRVPKPMTVKQKQLGQRAYESLDEPNKFLVNVLVSEIKPDTPAEIDMRQLMDTTMIQSFKKNPKYKNVTDRKLEYLGQTVSEISVETPEVLGSSGKLETGRISVRNVAHERKVYTVMVGGSEANIAHANTIFDTFEFLK